MRLSRQSFPAFAAASLAIVLATSAAVGFLLSVYCPEAAGSGIPQLKLAYWRDMGVVSWRIAWVKFVAGLLSLGGGTSLGREGPSQPSDSSPSRCLLGKRVPSCPRWPPSRAPWECSSRSRAFP